MRIYSIFILGAVLCNSSFAMQGVDAPAMTIESANGPVNVIPNANRIISLRNQNLQGELPEGILQIPNIQILYLQSNNLSGAITLRQPHNTMLSYLYSNQFTSFNAKEFEGTFNGYISSNPLEEFLVNTTARIILLPSASRPNIHADFNGLVFESPRDLNRLHDILQPNVRIPAQEEGGRRFLRISFYPWAQDVHPTSISEFLQNTYGVTANTIITKEIYENREPGEISVEGLMDGYDAAPFVRVLEAVRDGTFDPISSVKTAKK